MAYSICSDLYRLEDKDNSFPCSTPIEEETSNYEDDNYYEYDDDYDDCGYYEEEVDWDAEFYAANDPSNWD